jgi:hypothetical protein
MIAAATLLPHAMPTSTAVKYPDLVPRLTLAALPAKGVVVLAAVVLLAGAGANLALGASAAAVAASLVPALAVPDVRRRSSESGKTALMVKYAARLMAIAVATGPKPARGERMYSFPIAGNFVCWTVSMVL